VTTPTIFQIYELSQLATAAYVRMGQQPQALRGDGATFALEASTQSDGRLPLSLGRRLFDPQFAVSGVPLSFRALVELATQELMADTSRYPLAPGMQVSSEIHLGTRSILDYALSPVQKAWHEAGSER
jgi:hypothetical protein